MTLARHHRPDAGVHRPGWSMVDLPRHDDVRGSLSVVESGQHIDFLIARAYWLYDLPAVGSRGSHAHRHLHQLLVAVSGKVDIRVDDGRVRERIRLDRPDRGLLLGPMVWRELSNFSSGAVALVLASDRYDESDYFHDYEEFRLASTAGRS